MEMNLREWLIIAGLAIILGILVDGYRRVRRARRDSMEMSLGMGGGIENTPLDAGFSSELPNGGARVIRPAKSPDLEKPVVYPGKNRAQNVDAIDRESDVPVLVDIEPPCSLDNEQMLTNEVKQKDAVMAASEPDTEWSGGDPDAEWGSSEGPDWDDTLLESDVSTQKAPTRGVNATPVAGMQSEAKAQNTPLTVKAESVESTGKSKKFGNIFSGKGFGGWSKPEKDVPATVRKGPTDVIVVHVMSKRSAGFNGLELRKLLQACGLEHGEMSIFHRHEDVSTASPIQFSVANSVEPGFFDLATMDTITTPSISFFISLPGPANSMQAFDYMIETAQCVVRNLDGELKDEKRNIMTPQTVEHFRGRVREFERKQLSFRR